MEKDEFKTQVKDVLYQKAQEKSSNLEQEYRFANPLKDTENAGTEQRDN